ncbi:MAG: beta-ketoacyl synthase N-terminal-like domain-containing protein [Bryobacteraceae bacterium]
MSGAKVVITGTGIISAIGAGVEEFAEALYSGKSAVTSGPPPTAAIADFTPQTWLGSKGFKYFDRTARLLCVAGTMAIEKAAWKDDPAAADDERLGLMYGTLYGSEHSITSFDWVAVTEGPGMVSPLEFPNTVISSPGGQAAIKHHLSGPNWTLCQGFASSMHALQQASVFLKAGRVKAILAGGADESSPEAVQAFTHMGLLGGGVQPFAKNSQGTVLGEGSALWMLESEEWAKARGASYKVEILGFGQAQADTTTAASGAMAIRNALKNAGLAASQIGCIIASADGIPALDAAEAQALQEVFGAALANVPACAPKAALGETMGPGAILAATAGALALERQSVPPTAGYAGGGPLRLSAETQPMQGKYALVNAFSYDGNVMSMVLALCQ